MEWNGVALNIMDNIEWIEMEWTEMKWNKIDRNEMKWNDEFE